MLDDVGEEMSKSIQSAKEKLEEGKKLIRKRMKLIKLADREDWETVAQYVSDEMASDSEDEKRINRARRAASAKSEKQKKLRKQRRFPDYNKVNQFNPYNVSHPYHKRSQITDQRQCWGCNRYGHFISQCPFRSDSKYDRNRLVYKPTRN